MDSDSAKLLTIKKENDSEVEIMRSCEDENSVINTFNFNLAKDITLISDIKPDPEKILDENAYEQYFENSNSSSLKEMIHNDEICHSNGLPRIEATSTLDASSFTPEKRQSTHVREESHSGTTNVNFVKTSKHLLNSIDKIKPNELDSVSLKSIHEAVRILTSYVEKQRLTRDREEETDLDNCLSDTDANDVCNTISTSQSSLKTFIKKEFPDDNLTEEAENESYFSENDGSLTNKNCTVSDQNINNGAINPLTGNLCARSSINQTDELLEIVNEDRESEMDAMSSTATVDNNIFFDKNPELENINSLGENSFELGVPTSSLQHEVPSQTFSTVSCSSNQNPVQNPSALLQSFEQWNQDNNSVVMTELLKTMQNVLLGNVDIHTSYEFGAPSAWEIHNHNNGPVIIIQKTINQVESHFIPVTVEKPPMGCRENSSEEIIDVASEASVELIPATKAAVTEERPDVELIKTKMSSCSVRLSRISEDLVSSFINRQQKTQNLLNTSDSVKNKSKTACLKCGRTFKLPLNFEKHRCTQCNNCQQYLPTVKEFNLHLKHCINGKANASKSNSSSATKQTVKRSFTDTISDDSVEFSKQSEQSVSKKRFIDRARKSPPVNAKAALEENTNVDSRKPNEKVSDGKNKTQEKEVSSNRKKKRQLENSCDTLNLLPPVNEDNHEISAAKMYDTPVLSKENKKKDKKSKTQLKMKIIKSGNSTHKIQNSTEKCANEDDKVNAEQNTSENDDAVQQKPSSKPIVESKMREKQNFTDDQKLKIEGKKELSNSVKKLNPKKSQFKPKKILNLPKNKLRRKRTYFCSYCYKTFHNPQSFNLHISYHKDNNPYHCPDCSSSFTDPASLKDHMASHNRGNQYMCNMCGQEFSRYYNYFKHSKLAHTILPLNSRSG